MRPFLVYVIALASLPLGLAQPASESFYQAIRNNDVSGLTSLVKSSDVNSKDERGSTPLMYAAAFGSLKAMRLLVDAGADVNAKNAFDSTALLNCATDLPKVRFLIEKGANVNAQSKPGRTALLIAAGYSGGYEIVKLLIEKGADVSARDRSGETALLAATAANETATVRLLLAKGAPVNEASVARTTGTPGFTALANAAAEGNAEIIKLLLAKGAAVDAASAPEGMEVKNGKIALGLLTPLMLAAAQENLEAVKLLLDAGAQVNARDTRGMTPLMLAIASDHPAPGIVKLLLNRGADPALKSKEGETAGDWARKFQIPETLKALGIKQTLAANGLDTRAVGDSKASSPRQAAERSLALVEQTAATFFTTGGCVACHAQNMAGTATSIAAANGMRVNADFAAGQLKTVKALFAPADQILIQGMTVPGAMDTIAYSLFQLSAQGAPADRTIDAMVHNLAWQQRKEGNWHMGGLARPPIEDGDFSRTALCIRAFATYAPAGRKEEFDERIARAAAWLQSAKPTTTEDRTMQLLGLKWAKASRASLDRRVTALIATQRPDGGWAQTPYLASDAYATALALFTLHELDIPSTHAAFQRGAGFLIRTQLEDGSWHVPSRAPKFQPYFQSGFPHDHDQWISATATAWATIALSYASADKAVAGLVH